ncbi:MAG: CHAT domain-containing protein [Moorea sp. SIO2I5]|nr:CHAT domain-containing protein [Moorena sp. SIO2I5]
MELHQQNPSQGYDKQAFNISERSRARTLLELLTEANANIKEGVAPQLLAQEKSLQGQLDATEKQRLEIYNNPNSTDEQKTAINQKHKTLLEQYRELQTDLRQQSPNYAALKYPQPLTLEEVQQQILDQDTVLLQYSLGEEKSYLWVVTKEEMTSYQLPSQEEIEKRAENLLDFTTQGNSKAFSQELPPLSKIILDPVKDKLTKKRILLVADGVLQYIPFAALSFSENQQPLITEYDIINLPSSSSLATIRHETQARQSAPKALAILANPVFSRDDERVNNGKTALSQPQPSDLGSLALQRSVRNLEEGFDPLPGTRQEAEAILNLIPEDTEKTSAFDFDANLTAATNPELSQYRIVHLATHGILNTESPELSGIVLSLVDETGNYINGFLRLNDIFNLKLPADIVVLSACETGRGKDIKGEGLVGLTRGFMYAGSPRVLVSLWKVDDKATAEIMTRFYRLMLKKKLSPAEALRKAQLEMQQETEWRSPYYWAAFVLQGEWN